MSIVSVITSFLFLFGATFAVDSSELIEPDDRRTLDVIVSNLGADRPAQGRSVFDALFRKNHQGQWHYDVPYPFSRVLERLDLAVGIQSTNQESPLKAVLIPFSRCLNRDIANPHQFSSPRMVIAVDTEPTAVPEPSPVFIKNRLFLGYQPTANALEIISYNESAGRFEFQVVSDYTNDGKPKVEYAPRTLCMSCHQNGGPVFPRAPWGETSSNPDISKQLIEHGAGGMDRLIYPTGNFDRATDQARMFSALQTLWGPMCEGKTRSASIRCRAGLLTLILEKHFFRITKAFTDSELVSNYFLPIAGVGFIENWPNGLLIQTADIPDRRPLHLDPPTTVVPRSDPLNVRAIRLFLPFEEITRLIEGLASFMPSIDMKALDDALYADNSISGGLRWRFRGTCEIDKQEHLQDEALIDIECQVSDRSFGRLFNLLGDLSIEGQEIAAREPLNRWLVGDGMFFNNIYHGGSPIAIDEDHWKIELAFHSGDDRSHVWLPDGAAVESVVIRWPREPGAKSPVPTSKNLAGEAVMTLRPGYERVEASINRMIERAEAGNLGVFDDNVFRGGRIIQAILKEMAVDSTPWCCDDWSAMPPLAVSEPSIATRDDQRGFNHYCASCHALSNPSPTNFLSGTPQEVDTKLGECAEKIYYRLSMWSVEKNERDKTPMPPALQIAKLEQSDIPEQIRIDLMRLRERAETLLERDAGEVLANGYQNTRACGPF